MMKRLFLTTSAAGLVLGGAAWAQSQNVDVRTLADRYINDGATYVEVYQGPTQIKVEATQGNQTLEVVYDARGNMLHYEYELADAEDMQRRGVEFNREDRDFTFGDDDDDDSYDDDDDGYDDDDDDDDDDSDDRGGDDDDGDDDSGSGSDDDGDDD